MIPRRSNIEVPKDTYFRVCARQNKVVAVVFEPTWPKTWFSPCFSRDCGTSKREQLPFFMGKMTIIGARGAYNYSNFLETFYLTSQSGLVVGTHWAPGCFSSLIGLVQGKNDRRQSFLMEHPSREWLSVPNFFRFQVCFCCNICILISRWLFGSHRSAPGVRFFLWPLKFLRFVVPHRIRVFAAKALDFMVL